MKKLTLIASIGAGLEYYDFVIYAMLASYLSANFFPQADASSSLFQTFAVFAVGYFARPLGGLLFGLLGDLKGRKQAFFFSIILMAASTFGIGLLPTHSNIGLWSTAGLIVLRIMQGIAFGSEIPGAVTFLGEHSARQHRGMHTGFMVGSLGLGSGLGSCLILVLSSVLSHEQMIAWGWRLPFILGGLLALLGIWLRRHATETPAFVKLGQTHSPKAVLHKLFKHHTLAMIQGFGTMLLTACLLIFGISLPSYLEQYYNYDLPTAFRANTIGIFWATFTLPLFGMLSDRVGRKKLLCFTSFAFACLAQPIFWLLGLNNSLALLGFVLLYQTVISATAACYIPLLAELFPTPVRYTGIAVCYNIGGSLASLTPLVATGIVKVTGEFCNLVYFFIALALFTFLTTLSVNYTHQKSLD